MGYFSAQELSAIKNDVSKPKGTAKAPSAGKGGLSGFLSSAAHSIVSPFEYLGNAAIVNPTKQLAAQFTGNETAAKNAKKSTDSNLGLGDKGTDFTGGLKKFVGNSAQALLAPAGIGASTVKGAAAVGAATGASSALAEKDSDLGDVLAGGLAGGATAGALQGGGKILSKLTKAKEGTAAAGKRLTEAGSGLKADKNVGGVERLGDQADFMSKYTGTPRQNRVQMEADMKDLSKQVDEHLANTKTPVVGINMSTKLKNAIDDPNVFPELDLTQPRAIKLLEKNMKILGGKTEAQDTNNFVKTINPTAVKARDKLARGLPLTPNETAALATKRVIDEELSSIPEIAPLKKQMAQIFDVTPQIAKQAEKGISSPFLGGIKLKAPVQAASGVASKAGGILTKLSSGLPEITTPPMAQPVGNFASGMIRQGAANAAGSAMAPEQPMTPEQPVQEHNPNIGQQATAITADDILANEAQGQDTDPYSPANVQATVKSIIAQGGTQKDVSEFLNNAKIVNDLTATTSGNKPLNSTAAGVVADTTTGLKQLQALSKDIGSSNANNPVVGFLRSKNPLDTNAQSLQASIATAKQIVGKALEGGVLRKEDEAKYAKILPTINDTDAVAQAKIQKLITAISGRLTEYQSGISGGSGGTDLATLGL